MHTDIRITDKMNSVKVDDIICGSLATGGVFAYGLIVIDSGHLSSSKLYKRCMVDLVFYLCFHSLSRALRQFRIGDVCSSITHFQNDIYNLLRKEAPCNTNDCCEQRDPRPVELDMPGKLCERQGMRKQSKN